MKLLNIIPFISIILCFACTNETNKIEEVKEELPVIEPFTRYSSKNVLLEEGILKNGKRNGEWTYYDEKGEIKKVENYLNGILEGDFTEYRKRKVLHEGVYSKGKKHGEWKSYSPIGRIEKVENYSNNRLDGIYKEYKGNGEIKIEGLYLNGEKDKIWFDYSVVSLMKRELFYDQNILLYELQHLAPSTVTEENKSKILRLIHYSGKIPELPYYSVWFNAKLDGQLFVDGQKVIDLRKGEEIELLIEEREFSYSYRYAKGGPHRLDMQIDSIVLSKECEEYLVLVEDSVINKSIYDNKINELLTFLNDPVESNYNYDWNKRKHEFTVDSLSIEILNQVYKKRQEVTINELNNFIKDTTISDFKELWFYESYVWDNNEIDSLTLLAYYTKNKNIFIDREEHFANRISKLDPSGLISFNDINCFFNKKRDTLILNNDYCDNDKEIERFNSYNSCLLNISFEGYRINNFEFDVFLTCSEGGNGTGQKIIALSNKDGSIKYLNLTEIYLYEGYEKRVSSKVSFDGEFEIEVALYNKKCEFYDIGNSQRVSYEKNYIVVLNYELNDQMDLVFKGVKNINEFK